MQTDLSKGWVYTNPATLGHDRLGRNVIYAWTVGEETLFDLNGDNTYDLGGDTFTDQGEFFFDFNENDLREIGTAPGTYVEPYQEYDGDSNFDAGDTFFSGVACSVAAEAAGHCADLV